MLSPNGSSDTCIADGVFHIPMPCFHGALPVYPQVVTTFLHNASRRTRRAMHAASDAPYHAAAKPPPLGGLPPPHEACQEHAAHLVEWSTTLSSQGSLGACTSKVFPPSSMPLSRRTATQERKLLAVSCERLVGSDAGRDSAHRWAPCLGTPRRPPTPPPLCMTTGASADHFIRLEEDHERQRQPEGLGRLEVHDELEPRRLLDGQVGGLRAREDLVDV